MPVISPAANDDGAHVQSGPCADGEHHVSTAAPLDGAVSVAFVGAYAPRRCGIATFTADLAAAVAGVDRRAAPMARQLV